MKCHDIKIIIIVVLFSAEQPGGVKGNYIFASDTTTDSFTLEWTLYRTTPIPNTYNLMQTCKLVCESTFPPPIAIHSVASPFTVTGLAPYTECYFYLIGVYDEEKEYFIAQSLMRTLETSKLHI